MELARAVEALTAELAALRADHERERGSHTTWCVFSITTVSVVTNLTFYCGSQSSSNSLWQSASDVAGLLVSVLLQPNEEAIVEAARAFGNLSRDASVRILMTQRRVDELLVLLLGHANRDIVYTACGALINVASDDTCLQVRHKCALELP